MSEVIPEKFIWTRMNTDGGELLANILRRKNLERESGEGEHENTFWWGVGENKAPAIRDWLVTGANDRPAVCFSKALGKAQQRDENPESCLLWTTYQIFDVGTGRYSTETHVVPKHVIVSSGKRENYYALVCLARRKLEMSCTVELYGSHLRNLNRGKKLGQHLARSPQTTCVVEYTKKGEGAGGPYLCHMLAQSIHPYFVKMGGQSLLSDRDIRLLDRLGGDDVTVEEYGEVARQIRKRATPQA